MKKWVIPALALSLALCSCGKKTSSALPTSQQLRFNIHSEPPSLDPRKATDSTSISLIKACFEGLMRLNAEGDPVLAAAERYEVSEDQTRYTFYLRDAKWSDGHPVTAHDFEHTTKTLLAPSFPTELGFDLYVIKNAQKAKAGEISIDQVGIKALDDKTLQFDLEHPVPYFLSLTACPFLFAAPSHITEKNPNWAENSGSLFVGNGPFKMSKWRHHNLIVLVKNDQYWDAEHVKLQELHLPIIEDENTELSMYENGELDWTGNPLSSIPIDALPSLIKQGDVHSYPIAGVYYYVFNTQAIPFTNVNIRRAFSLAINRKAVIDNITQSGQTPAMSFIPPSLWDHSVQYFKDDDVTEAKRLFAIGMKELGLSLKDFPEIKLSYNTLSAHHKIAQAIQEQWSKAFGVKISLANMEWKVYLNELRQRKFQVARLGGIANIPDPITFLDGFQTLSARNDSQWTNPQFTQLLKQAELEGNAEKRFALLHQAEKILIDEMPVAPIYFYAGSYMKKPYVHGITFSELNDIDFKSAYVDTEPK